MAFIQFLLYLNFGFLIILVFINFHNLYYQKNRNDKNLDGEVGFVNYLSNDKYKEAMDQLKLEAMISPLQTKESLIEDAVVQKQYSAFEKSQFSVLEALIHYYRREALKEGILFTFNLSGNLTEEIMKEFHIIHIAGNLLQNGIEALNQKGMPPSRRLDFNIEVNANELVIRQFNTYPEELCQVADLDLWTSPGFSTKGSEGRGNGLAIIKRLVRERDGVLYLDKNQGITLVVEFDL